MNEIGSASIQPASIKDVHISDAAAMARAKLAQRVLGIDNIPLSQFRVWDAQQTNLGNSASSDDLALVTGTLGTDLPTIQAGDLKAAGSTTRYAKTQVALPADYEAGETVTVEITAGMKTTIADVSCTVDCEAYLSDELGAVGADLCTTAATTINSTTAAAKSFTITPTSLVAGSVLDVRIAIICNDAATATAVIPRIVAVRLKSDRR